MVTCWSRSTSDSYALIGQNFTAEFMRKIYAASGKLFADSWSCKSFFITLWCQFNCLFPLDVKMNSKYSCFQDYSVIHGWFVYWVFGWHAPLVKAIGSPISDSIVLTSLDAQKLLKSCWGNHPEARQLKHWRVYIWRVYIEIRFKSWTWVLCLCRRLHRKTLVITQQRALFAPPYKYSMAKAMFRNQNYNTGQLRCFDNNLSRTFVKTSWNIFYELYIDKVIRRVHQFIDQNVYR